MKTLLLKILLASGLLNAASLLETNVATEVAEVDTKGFPFGFITETAADPSSIDIASFASNWVFWAVVALVGFYVLRWVWDKFSRMVFYILVAVGVFVYAGSIGIW